MNDSFDLVCPFTHIVTDVDGVFTDGSFLYSTQGKTHKTFGPHDSDGIKILRDLGISVSAITADRRGFDITKRRMEDMGVSLELVSESDRYEYVNKHFDINTIAFVGDGIHDAGLLKNCAFSFAPSNAPEFVGHYAKHNCKASGGNGVFLEIALYVRWSWFTSTQNEWMRKLYIL